MYAHLYFREVLTVEVVFVPPNKVLNPFFVKGRSCFLRPVRKTLLENAF